MNGAKLGILHSERLVLFMRDNACPVMVGIFVARSGIVALYRAVHVMRNVML